VADVIGNLGEFDAEVYDLTARVADQVGRRFADIVERDDVYQELWVWLLEPKGRKYTERWLAEGQQGKLARALYNAGREYVERERRAQLGMDWRDEYRYSRPEVSRLLPFALDPDYAP
jgi:hypothetical protein